MTSSSCSTWGGAPRGSSALCGACAARLLVFPPHLREVSRVTCPARGTKIMHRVSGSWLDACCGNLSGAACVCWLHCFAAEGHSGFSRGWKPKTCLAWKTAHQWLSFATWRTALPPSPVVISLCACTEDPHQFEAPKDWHSMRDLCQPRGRCGNVGTGERGSEGFECHLPN